VSANQVAAIQSALSILNSIATDGNNVSTTKPPPGSPAALIIPPYPSAKPCFNKNTDSEDQEMVALLDRTMNEEEKKKKMTKQAEALRAARVL
jgi:hypothetical protein